MNRNALYASLVAATAGVVLLRVYMYRFELEATGGPKASVLVFLRDVEAGQALEADAVGTRALPDSYLESRHIRARDKDQVIGLKLAVAGRASEALLWTDLASLRRRAPHLANLVPEGLRAMTLAHGASSSDGLIEPGDRVDLLATRRESSADTPSRTTTVAEDLLVLAVGSSMARPDARKELRGDVTVAVTLAQSRVIAEAELGASLRLVLRNPAELELTPEQRPETDPVAAVALPTEHP